MPQRSGSGPGNKVIATTLLESLAVRGQAAARERAARALGLADGGLAEAKSWLPDDALGRMFIAVDADASLARAVGHRLVAPDATGLPLYSLGLATPEKAYRRVQSLLPRESAASFWVVDEIGSGSARIRFHDREIEAKHPSADRPAIKNGRAQTALCALRVGMLEAVPGLFGLLPASVKESSCLARGAEACCYEIVWQRTSTAGVVTGSLVGLGLAAGLAATSFVIGAPVFPVAASAFSALGVFVLAVLSGRSLDLHRQLEAVAGARRGHLALFDQVDDALASKLDALARADAKLEGDEFVYRPDRSLSASNAGALGAGSTRSEILDAARKIHAAAGELESWFDDDAVSSIEASEAAEVAAQGRVREIRTWAAEITEDGESESLTSAGTVDLAALVSRAVATARPTLPVSAIIHVDRDNDLPPIPCEPAQIEQVVVQLLHNAVEASRCLTESPEVFVSLRKVPRGIEISIEDRGVGIEPSEIDEAFDPFFGESCADFDEGYSLPACLRIVEHHGGELRIETEDRPGTRVTVLLPDSASR